MKNYVFKVESLTNQLILKLSKLKLVYLVIIAVAMNLLITAVLVIFIFPQHNNPHAHLSKIEMFIVAVIVSPILETWMVQGGVIHQLLKYFNNSRFIAILFSSIIFGLLHFFILPFSPLPFMLKSTLSGLLYATLFFSAQLKTKNPLIAVMVAHSIFNAIAFVINNF